MAMKILHGARASARRDSHREFPKCNVGEPHAA
jgi:hypothetical protein